METFWGIDLGGTKIEVAVLSQIYPPQVICRKRIPTESQQGYRHILHRIGELLELVKTETGLKPTRIGIGTPGTLDPQTQRMKNCNTTCLNGQPLLADLEELLGVPVRMANDANCFALAEARMGAAAEVVAAGGVVFGIIMGTGVGGGVVVNGQVLNGLQGIGGEWGHNFLDASGGPCYCGLEGCVETVISGPALEQYYLRHAGAARPLPEIVQRHLQGSDEVATATINRLLYFFGRGVAQVINLIDPHAVVIGGGLGNIDLLYTEGVRHAEQFVFNQRLETRFLKPKLGDSAGVFGAASLLLS